MQVSSPLKNLFDLLGGTVILTAIAISQPVTTSAKTTELFSKAAHPVIPTAMTGVVKTERVELVKSQKSGEEEDGKTVPPNFGNF